MQDPEELDEGYFPEGFSSAEEWAEVFAILIDRARVDFLAFFTLFCFVNGNKLGPLQEYLIDLVQDVTEGLRGNRQAVSLPPQHGKSEVFSRLYPAWLMGTRPGVSVAITAFSHELVEEFSESVRRYVEHPWYRLVFPEAAVDPRMNRMSVWGLTTGSRLRAKSVKKKLTGRRVDVLIIDDAHAGRQEAESPVERKKIVRWYFADCMSRLAPDAEVWLIGTRWHPEDLIGHLTSEEYVRELQLQGQTTELFEVTNISAIAEEDDPLGRQEGEPLAPELGRNREFLNAKKAMLPAYEWSSQFMGHPRAASSGQADITRINRIPLSALPEGLEFVRGWDLALTEKTTSDYSAGALCARDAATGCFYVIDMFHKKLNWPKLKKHIVEIGKLERDSPTQPVYRIGMEAVSAFGIGLQEVKKELMGLVKVEPRNPKKGGKLLRAQPWFNIIEAGKMYVVDGAWNKVFLDELDQFPQASHDDQVDAVSVAYESLYNKASILFA